MIGPGLREVWLGSVLGGESLHRPGLTRVREALVWVGLPWERLSWVRGSGRGWLTALGLSRLLWVSGARLQFPCLGWQHRLVLRHPWVSAYGYPWPPSTPAPQRVLLSLVLVALLEVADRGRRILGRACTPASAELQEELLTKKKA